MDINHKAIALNRIIKERGINLYLLIDTGIDIDYLEYWVSGPRPPNLESALRRLVNQPNQKAPILTPLQCAALNQLRVVLYYWVERRRCHAPETWFSCPMSSSQFPEKTRIDEEGYGLVCLGKARTELVFDHRHTMRYLNALTKKSNDKGKEEEDSKKQGGEPTICVWRSFSNRKYLTIGLCEVPKVVDG